jgi:acyl dehydratase
MPMADTASPPPLAERAPAPLRVGEHFGRRLHYDEVQIAEFARLSLDSNPLHREGAAARESAFAGVIASGQHSAALMMGLMASHFSRSDEGVAREMLCLNVNFSFKAPVRARAEVDVRWVVSAVEFNNRLGGWVGQLNGSAFSGGTDCVIARATVLVKRLA